MVIHATCHDTLSASIRIAVVDDHPMFREGTVGMLRSADGIEVVAEGATARDAVAIAQESIPDVMLLDLCLPGGGVNAAASIACACPKVRIIALTASEDEQDITSVLRAGARGYILKGSSGREVVEAVRAIVRGDSYVAPSLAARLLIKKGSRIEAKVEDNLPDLSGREAEVFALVSRGMSNKEVARNLRCTERTIKHHMTNIMQKLDVRNRVQAVLKFQRG
jgi:two-component system, NarL family, nitrate/nitrite response regulator NarL